MDRKDSGDNQRIRGGVRISAPRRDGRKCVVCSRTERKNIRLKNSASCWSYAVFADPFVSHDAVLVEDEDAPLRYCVALQVSKILMEHIVLVNDVSCIVTEDWKVQTVLLCESFVRPGIVDVYSYNLGVNLAELREIISQLTHFLGADTCEGAGEER